MSMFLVTRDLNRQACQTIPTTTGDDVFFQDFLYIVEKLDQYKKMLAKKREKVIKQSRDMKPEDAGVFLCKIRKIEQNKTKSIEFTRRQKPEDVFLDEFRKIVEKLDQYKKMLGKKREYVIKQSRDMKPEDAGVFLHKILKIGQNKSSAESIKFTRRVRHEINTKKKLLVKKKKSKKALSHR